MVADSLEGPITSLFTNIIKFVAIICSTALILCITISFLAHLQRIGLHFLQNSLSIHKLYEVGLVRDANVVPVHSMS